MHGERKLGDARCAASPPGIHLEANGRIWRCVCVLLLMFLLVLADDTQDDSEPLINMKWGLIRGKWDTSFSGRRFASFLGIPYALPPLGDLRFRNSQRWNRPWTTVRDATMDGEACTQLDGNYDVNVIGGEDCLNLNIFVPMISDSQCLMNFPVLVYIHGGAFIIGSNNSTHYGGEYLMDHDVILVTVNYRLNALGFFSTTNRVAPGNYGLKDVVTALEWIQENIYSFGGDPKSVTIMGASAGAAIAHMLVLTKKTEGLFNKWIAFGGVALGIWSTQPTRVYRQKCLELASLLGCLPGKDNNMIVSNETISENPEGGKKRANNDNIWSREDYNLEDEEEMMKCMRALDAERIVKETARYIIWRRNPLCIFGPTLEEDSEDAILAMHPIKRMKNGLFRDMPAMLQVVKNEGLTKTIDFFTDPNAKDEMIENFERYLPILAEYQTVLFDTSSFATAVQDFYFDGNLTLNLLQNITNVVTDAMIYEPLAETLRYQSKWGKSSIYLSVFAYAGTFSYSFASGNLNHYGVCHNDDLNYIFPVLNNIFKDLMLHNTENDITMIHIMTEMIVNFVQEGVPRARMISAWPDYRDHHEFMRFGIGTSPDIVVQTGFECDSLDFWEKMRANISADPPDVNDIPEMSANEKDGATDCGLMINLWFLTIVLFCVQ